MKKTIIALLILLVVGAVLYATETAVLTSWVERRNQEPLIKPVWEFKVTGSFDDNDVGNVIQAIAVNGIILKVILIVPDTFSDPACEVEILDNADNLIFDSTDLAVGTHTFDIYEPVIGTIDVVMGPAGVFGAGGGDIVVYLRGI